MEQYVISALPEMAKELIDGTNFAAVVTLMPDSSPQVSIVWVEREGDLVVFSTTDDRTKTRNARRDPRVAVTVWDAANPYRHVAIRGRVKEITRDGAEEAADRLSMKYLGKPFPFRVPGEVRVVVKIEPEKIGTFG